MAVPAALPVDQGRHRDPRSRSGLRLWLLTGFALVGFSVLALVTAAYLGTAFGVRTALLALVVACLPLGIVVPAFLWLDRFEAEPTRWLVLAFLWGALVASTVAALTNTGVLQVVRAAASAHDALLVTAVVAAPFIEEAAKGAFLLLLWWFGRREFDGVTDGIVYAGITATGFAFTENIQYLAEAYRDGGGAALTGTFITRCLMSPFAHPMFTALTGVGVGVAVTSRSRLLKVVAPAVGYLLAVLAHSLWNLSALTSGQGMLTVYGLVDVPIFVAFVALLMAARRREGRLIGSFLRPYADAGWLAPVEVAMLASMPRRREARVWARANAGRNGLAAMRRFQDSASELALLRRRMSVAGASEVDVAEERRLLGSLVAMRRYFTGHAVY